MLDAIIRTNKAHITKRLLSTVRGLFDRVHIFVIVYGPAPMATITRTIGRRYRVQVIRGEEANTNPAEQYPLLAEISAAK